MKKVVITQTVLFSCLLIIGLLVSCEKEADPFEAPTNENPSFLIGKWIEKEPEGLGQFAGTNHTVEFTEDQFFLKFRYWTDGITPGDVCANSYTAYFRGGGAEVIGDSIRIIGKATNENFEFQTAECDRYATFQKTYKFKTESEEVLILNSDATEYAQIRLEKE